MNGRAVCLVLMLCEETFRALKNGIHHRPQLCPNHLPRLLRWFQRNEWNAETSLVAQWAGTHAFYWDLCLYLDKKSFCSLSSKKQQLHLQTGCGCWLQSTAFLGGGKNKEATPGGGERECEHFSPLYYILLFNVKQTSSCSIHRLLCRKQTVIASEKSIGKIDFIGSFEPNRKTYNLSC